MEGQPMKLTLSLEGSLSGERRVQSAAGGSGFSSSLRFNKDRIVIGSIESADVRLSGQDISPIHAVIERPAGQIPGKSPGQVANPRDSAIIYDLASESGVFVNGQKTVTAPLQQGDRIRIGEFELVFGQEGAPSEAENTAPLILESESEVEQIFDYRASSQRALEVVMSWRGTILDVEHFVKQKTVTAGPTRGSDFGIPPLLSSQRFPLVARRGGDFAIQLGSPALSKAGAIRGIIQRGGRLQTFDELRAAGPASDFSEIPLGDDEFAKLSVGEIDFYLSYTDAPPRLRVKRLWDRDPFFLKVFLSSLALSVGTVTTLLRMEVPQRIEAEKIPDRIATILYQPEKYSSRPKIIQERAKPEPAQATSAKPEPVKPKPEPTKVVKVELTPRPVSTPKPIPKEINVAPQATEGPKPVATAKGGKKGTGQKSGKEGAGAKAVGKEGTRGSPKAAPSTTHQAKATRPSPQGGRGGAQGNSQVPGEGNVDILSSATAKITDLLGNSAEKLGTGGSKLKGFGGFTTQGSGGLALSGAASGGGGNAKSLGGLSDHGRGGGRVGTGLGAEGTGSGVIGGKARIAIRSGGGGEATVMGTIDTAAIEAALEANRDRFRNCYEREINAEESGLAGRVSVTFVIGQAGRVTQAGVESTTMKYRSESAQGSVERCVVAVIRSIEFPIPKGAGIVQVTRPFKFSPTQR